MDRRSVLKNAGIAGILLTGFDAFVGGIGLLLTGIFMFHTIKTGKDLFLKGG